jgi:hypothetical protein
MTNDQLVHQLVSKLDEMKNKCGENHPMVKVGGILRSMCIRLADLKAAYENCVDIEKRSKLVVKLNKFVDEINFFIHKVEGMTKQVEFVDYVYQFYGPDGLYPMNTTMDQINEVVEQLKKESHNFAWDSIDRELVRDILIDFEEKKNG